MPAAASSRATSFSSAKGGGHEQHILTAEQLQKLRSELMEEVGADKAATMNDDDLARFFRAVSGREKEALRRLALTAKWRHDAKPHEQDCTLCLKDHKSHYMHLVGHDKLGRPVIYSCFAMVSNHTVKHLVEHMIQTFEFAITTMPPGVESWVWLNDFFGFGLGDMNPALALSFIELTGKHYPERLAALMVLDAPSIMTPCWNMVRPFVDNVTHKKIRFLPNDLAGATPERPSHLRDALEDLLDEEMVEWVTAEMAAIRAFRRKKAPRPVYDISELRRAVSEGRLPESSAGAGGKDQPAASASEQQLPVAHSHYGTRTLLKRYLAEPSLLSIPGASKKIRELAAAGVGSSESTSK